MKRLYPRLNENARVLRAAYNTLAADVHQEQVITPPAEWLLDHFPLVTAEIRAVRLRIFLARTTASCRAFPSGSGPGTRGSTRWRSSSFATATADWIARSSSGS